MRQRRNREINVFSMSALDLFASGLGAFLILMLILFPYYKKDSDASAAVNKKQEALNSCEQKLQQSQQSLSQCTTKLGSGILLVSMSWESADKNASSPNDMDLYVTDPKGYRYYYGQKNNPPGKDFPTQARISLDVLTTPGFEVFEEPAVRAGKYTIAIMLFPHSNRGSLPLNVRIMIYTRDGSTEIPVIAINPSTDAGIERKIATVDVSASGDARISQ